MQKLLMIVVAAIVFGLIARVAIGFFSTSRVATGLISNDVAAPTLSGCDDLQNCTASTATNSRNLIEALTYNVPASDAIAAFSRLITSQSGTQIITQEPNYLHATYKTTLLGYTDDLELLLDESSGILNVRSASRIGRSDLGANRKRIEALRQLANNS